MWTVLACTIIFDILGKKTVWNQIDLSMVRDKTQFNKSFFDIIES